MHINDKINGYFLDEDQQRIVLDNSKYLLVVAGAGSGKTLTILGKINYLLFYKKINPNEIICISFTNKSAKSLEKKIKQEFQKNVPVFTFHKLAINILKDNNIEYDLADSECLKDIINYFFTNVLTEKEEYMFLVLNYFKKFPLNNIKQEYEKILSTKEFYQLSNEIETFINLYKCNNNKINNYKEFLKQIKTLNYFEYQKNKTFLILSLNIYLYYKETLKEENLLDFNDLIIEATNMVKKKYTKKVKYIIIDEYQDTSLIRFNLVKEILSKTEANLLVVGDDYQSIYKFTGCDISLFTNFQSYFKTARVLKINNTYRFSQDLINITSTFIMKNKTQIKKNIKSKKQMNKPIEIIYYKNKVKSLISVLLKIKSQGSEILILGRNNNDIYRYINNDFKLEDDMLIYLKNKSIKIKYLTIHKSKGLESDNVIILNLENNLLGFPNKIKNSKVIDLLTINKEKYKYAEERRLFYVALTRTKNKVYLLTPKYNQSTFVVEIKKIIK